MSVYSSNWYYQIVKLVIMNSSESLLKVDLLNLRCYFKWTKILGQKYVWYLNVFFIFKKIVFFYHYLSNLFRTTIIGMRVILYHQSEFFSIPFLKYLLQFSFYDYKMWGPKGK